MIRTNIDSSITAPDGISVADITGNGLLDLLVNAEAGQLFWYEQTERGVFTKHTIHPSTISGAKLEGAQWWYINGGWSAVSLDQTGGRIILYTPDTPGQYSGTWTGATILSGRNRLQNARVWDIDNDGVGELVYTWEGTEPSTGGGVHRLRYNGGSTLSSSSYTDTVMVTMVGVWWLTQETRNLGGAQNGLDFAFTSRDRGNNSNQGVYVALAPENISDPWVTTRIESQDLDWLHLDFGCFYGNKPNDIVAHSYDGHLRTYDHSNSWASTTLQSTFYGAFFQGMTMPISRNGRNKILTAGSGGAGVNKVVVYSYNGTAWEQEEEMNNNLSKMDDGFYAMDIDGNGYYEIVTLDTSTADGNDGLLYVTFDRNGDERTQIKCTGGSFNNVII